MAELIVGSKLLANNGPGQNGDPRASSDLHPAKPALPPNTQTRDVGKSDLAPAHGQKRQTK
jgi:hypothetical protein